MRDRNRREQYDDRGSNRDQRFGRGRDERFGRGGQEAYDRGDRPDERYGFGQRQGRGYNAAGQSEFASGGDNEYQRDRDQANRTNPNWPNRDFDRSGRQSFGGQFGDHSRGREDWRSGEDWRSRSESQYLDDSGRQYTGGREWGNRGGVWDEGFEGSRGGRNLQGYRGQTSSSGGYGSRDYGSSDYGSGNYGSSDYGSSDYGSGGAGSGSFGSGNFGPRASGSSYGYGTHPYGTEGYGMRERSGDRSGWDSADDDNRRDRGLFGKGPKGYTRSDERIRDDVCDRLTDASDVDASDITVSVKDGEVTLEGTIQTRRMKHRAEDIVDNISGVRDIHNRLRVQKPLLTEMKERLKDQNDPQHYQGTRPQAAAAPLSGQNGTRTS